MRCSSVERTILFWLLGILVEKKWKDAMELSSEQLTLKARAAALSNGLLRKRGGEIDKSREYPWDVVDALKAERFMGMTIPKEYGGQGSSFLDAVLVIEEMARSCTVS